MLIGGISLWFLSLSHCLSVLCQVIEHVNPFTSWSPQEPLDCRGTCLPLGLLSRPLENPAFSLPCRFRPHSRERWTVGCPGLALHPGRPQAECGGHPQRSLAEVWSELLYQVRHSLDWGSGQRILRDSVCLVSNDTDTRVHPATLTGDFENDLIRMKMKPVFKPIIKNKDFFFFKKKKLV